MRLIDADALMIRMMQKYDEVGEYLDDIDLQPTAYNVDKVEEELERIRGIAFITIANTGNEENDTMYAYTSKIVDEAIDIVRRGGIE